METAKEYISFLIDFALQHDIELSDPGLQRTDDIERYLWSCIKHKRCCLCGKPADIHHVDSIGRGQDRRNYDDSEHKKMALCRLHHSEAHNIGVDSFNENTMFFGVIYKGDSDDNTEELMTYQAAITNTLAGMPSGPIRMRRRSGRG